ncbi:MAG: sigma-70 family RNA polymerase sigma factor [Lachnospiraceae bacterium]|nr:sigma-70 family RNA polymerase sigma factor [Lachnospiraceae bacterium]
MKSPDNNYDVVFDDAIEQYGDMIYRICLTIAGNAEDAKDAFQETFLRLVKNKDKITCEEHLKAWLIRVASNCAKSAAASTWNRTTQGLDEEAAGGEALYKQEENGLLSELQRLPKKYSVTLYLYYYEEYSVREIAVLLQKKENSIKTLLARGRKLLRKSLEEGGEMDATGR